jgi:hypothetical protein
LAFTCGAKPGEELLSVQKLIGDIDPHPVKAEIKPVEGHLEEVFEDLRGWRC